MNEMNTLDVLEAQEENEVCKSQKSKGCIGLGILLGIGLAAAAIGGKKIYKKSKTKREAEDFCEHEDFVDSEDPVDVEIVDAVEND